MKSRMEQEITDFFRNFALQVLQQAHVDPNNPKAFKLAMLDHYEQIYPAFSLTEVFKENYNQAEHNRMVETYKLCFTQLLMGRLP